MIPTADEIAEKAARGEDVSPYFTNEFVRHRKSLNPSYAMYDNKPMKSDPAELLRDALSLPSEARAALIDSLLESMDVEVDDDAQEAWREEICRRLRQIDSGAARMIPWDDARRELRTRLKR